MFFIELLSLFLVFLSGLLLHFPIKRLVYSIVKTNVEPIRLFVLDTTNFWNKMKYGLYGNYIIKLNNSFILITRLENYFNTMDKATEAKSNFGTTSLYINPRNPFRAIKDFSVVWQLLIVLIVFLIGLIGVFRKKITIINFSDRLFCYCLFLLNIIVIGITVYFYSIDLN